MITVIIVVIINIIVVAGSDSNDDHVGGNGHGIDDGCGDNLDIIFFYKGHKLNL